MDFQRFNEKNILVEKWLLRRLIVILNDIKTCSDMWFDIVLKRTTFYMNSQPYTSIRVKVILSRVKYKKSYWTEFLGTGKILDKFLDSTC